MPKPAFRIEKFAKKACNAYFWPVLRHLFNPPGVLFIFQILSTRRSYAPVCIQAGDDGISCPVLKTTCFSNNFQK